MRNTASHTFGSRPPVLLGVTSLKQHLYPAACGGIHANNTSPTHYNKPPISTLKQKLTRKWPEAIRSLSDQNELVFSTGFPELDSLFPMGGIPYGQLIEITGGVSSGKTGLLFRMLSCATQNRIAAYVDFSNAFFPDAASASGLDLSRLLVIKPNVRGDDCIKNSLRTAELLLRDRNADIIVFDLVGYHRKDTLPIGLLHRLRLKTVRAKGLVIFLTQPVKTNGVSPNIIPSSMASLRLTVGRTNTNRLAISITKSRITTEGTHVEVQL